MIIFNAAAILIGIVIGIIVGPLYWLFPNFMESTWGNVLSFGIATVVSIFGDLAGIKGRLFFLPIWLLGIIGMGVTLHSKWGWWGPALAATVVVVALGLLLLVAAAGEKKTWAEAPGNLNSARDSLAKGVNDETWKFLGEAFFVPAFSSDTPERCRHNLEVLALARKALPPNAGALELRVFDALAQAYGKGFSWTEGQDKVNIPSELTSAMAAMLGNKGALPEEEDRKALLEELDKPATAAS